MPPAEPHLTNRWRDAAGLMARVDAAASEGSIVVVKVDGERGSDRYTVVLSGGRLRQNHFRKDGDDIVTLLGEAVEFYDANST